MIDFRTLDNFGLGQKLESWDFELRNFKQYQTRNLELGTQNLEFET